MRFFTGFTTMLLILGTSNSPAFPQHTHRNQIHKPDTTTDHTLYDDDNVVMSRVESQIFHLINEHRATLQLPPLRLASSITSQARTYSQSMADSPVPHLDTNSTGQKDRFNAVAKAIPHTSCKENVGYVDPYYSQDPASTLMKAWLHNPEKRALIEGPYNLTGISAARDERGAYYVTQIFVQL